MPVKRKGLNKPFTYNPGKIITGTGVNGSRFN
jgi:hypothetical protein